MITYHQRDGRARASLGLITRNKSGQAQPRRVGRTCKQPRNGSSGEGSRVASAEAAQTAISRCYAEKEHVPESTIGPVMRAWGFSGGACLHWSDLAPKVRVRRAPVAAQDPAKVEAHRRCDLGESGIEQPRDTLEPQILRSMAESSSDGTRLRVLSAARACSPLA